MLFANQEQLEGMRNIFLNDRGYHSVILKHFERPDEVVFAVVVASTKTDQRIEVGLRDLEDQQEDGQGSVLKRDRDPGWDFHFY